MQKNDRGFSLIELMIVASIISILAAISIPNYQHYIRKARFAEIITQAQAIKTIISMALQSGIPKDELQNGSYDIPANIKPTANLESIEVQHGIITATASALIDKVTYILTPNDSGSQWKLTGSCLKKGYCHA